MIRNWNIFRRPEARAADDQRVVARSMVGGQGQHLGGGAGREGELGSIRKRRAGRFVCATRDEGSDVITDVATRRWSDTVC